MVLCDAVVLCDARLCDVVLRDVVVLFDAHQWYMYIHTMRYCVMSMYLFDARLGIPHQQDVICCYMQ